MEHQCTSIGDGFPDPTIALMARTSPPQPIRGETFEFVVEGTLGVCGAPVAEVVSSSDGFRIELDVASCPPNAGAPIPYNYRCELPASPLAAGQYSLQLLWVGDTSPIFHGGFAVAAPVPVPLYSTTSALLGILVCIAGLVAARLRNRTLSANLTLQRTAVSGR